MHDIVQPQRASGDCCVLVLQGGGALGAYQAGVFEALAEADYLPRWVAGISIGAINAALIAGNPPERRVRHLREFWRRVSSGVPFTLPPTTLPLFDGWGRRLFNEWSAMWGAIAGVPGFFRPRLGWPWNAGTGASWPWLALPGSPEAVSLYDTTPLRETLLELVDFDLINRGTLRFSVGAVNVATGNLAWFDNRDRFIEPEHVMASGALPPGFPPVMIDGEPYWDGGIVSNTPLQYVLDERARETNRPRIGGIGGGHDPLVVFQVDLFSARGISPRTIPEALQREKDIRFSSRTRLNTDMHRRIEALEAAAGRLADRLPRDFAQDPDLALLTSHADDGPVTILHLINRPESFESQNKDYEFSRMTVDGHWSNGMHDVRRSLASPGWTGRVPHQRGIVTLDLA